MNFEILQVTRAHLAQIAGLEKQCFPEPWSENALELFLKPDAVAFAALDGDTVLGYIGMLQAIDEGQILNLAVLPDRRRCGIGKALLSRILAEARDRGLESLSLEVRVSNSPAIHLYESCGFARAGLRKHFYRHPAEDALVLVKPLRKSI